jgi:hypothetical protein
VTNSLASADGPFQSPVSSSTPRLQRGHALTSTEGTNCGEFPSRRDSDRGTSISELKRNGGGEAARIRNRGRLERECAIPLIGPGTLVARWRQQVQRLDSCIPGPTLFGFYLENSMRYGSARCLSSTTEFHATGTCPVFGSFMGGYHVLSELLFGELADRLNPLASRQTIPFSPSRTPRCSGSIRIRARTKHWCQGLPPLRTCQSSLAR